LFGKVFEEVAERAEAGALGANSEWLAVDFSVSPEVALEALSGSRPRMPSAASYPFFPAMAFYIYDGVIFLGSRCAIPRSGEVSSKAFYGGE